MSRRSDPPRSPFAAAPPGAGGAGGPVWRSAAPRGRSFLRLAVVPFAALAAVLGGLVFVVLLPICGIASIGEAVARASWELVRDAVAGASRRPRARS